jgi:uncharacterized membrane protein (UPF0127 family)
MLRDMHMPRRYIVFIVFVILLVASVLFIERATPLPLNCPTGARILSLHGDVIVSMAETPDAQERGLSGHVPLLPHEGMLFRFDHPGRQQFWMKDMLFALDIIWLDANLHVLSSVSNATPESYPKIFPSPDGTQYVLEVTHGFLSTRKVEAGDIAELHECGEVTK